MPAAPTNATVVSAAPPTATPRCGESASAMRKYTHTAAHNHSPANAIADGRSGVPRGIRRPVEPGGGIDDVVVERRWRQRALLRDAQQFTVDDACGTQCLSGARAASPSTRLSTQKRPPLVAVGHVVVTAGVARADQPRQFGQERRHRDVGGQRRRRAECAHRAPIPGSPPARRTPPATLRSSLRRPVTGPASSTAG